MNFPKDFWWGAAASAPQTEGRGVNDGKSDSTWDRWFEMRPDLFNDNQGPQTTSDVYHRYKEDIKNMKYIGLNSYRTSISWTRLLPDGKTLNPKAVTFYRDLFSTLKENGIKPIVNLFHFDMPWWMMEQGGWENPEIADYFAYYAKVCVEQFGDIVDDWTTFNEPIVHVECSYIYGFHYPAIIDFKKAIIAGYYTMLAHAKAVIAMRKQGASSIGIILNLTPVYPKSNDPKDLKAAKIADLLNVKSFLDVCVKGSFNKELVALLKEYDLLPEVNNHDLECIKQAKIDFIGVNYYQPKRVQAPLKTKTSITVPEDLYIPYEWEERRINPYRGWEIYPQALKDIATMIQNEYDNFPWFVSENGMGVADEARFIDESGQIQDDYRIEFMTEHLELLNEAISEGSSCFGYHSWTFVDCWSWLNGYRNRYGFYSLDLETQKRTIKKSGLWFKTLIEKQRG